MTSARRQVKIEKPRPLRLSTIGGDQSVTMVLTDMDFITHSLSSTTSDQPSYSTLVSLCENLKKFGPQLDKVYKDQLDRCYVSLRNGCRDDKLPLAARYRLLEVIELRAMKWLTNENYEDYYRKKIQMVEVEEQDQLTPYSPNVNISRTNQISPSITPTVNVYPNHSSKSAYSNLIQQTVVSAPSLPALSPGEILKSSGKFTKPTRVPGKNLVKDEVVIRNLDSGKVMGLKGRRVHMIEELSETVISFQRVNPGARERLVQITGPGEENLRHASQLIEDTIRRNASPIRDDQNNSFSNMGGVSPPSLSPNISDEGYHSSPLMNANKKFGVISNFEEPVGEYRYTVKSGGESIRITGTNLSFVKEAKLVLEEHFKKDNNFNNGTVITFGIDEDSTCSLPSPSACFLSANSSDNSYFPDSPNVSDIHSPPPTCMYDEPQPVAQKNPTLVVTRQPIIPTSSKNDVENAEKVEKAVTKESKTRRALFAKTNENMSNDGSLCPDTSSHNSTPFRITYTREFLVKRADNELSQRTPKNWSKVIRKFPFIIKKSSHHLATLIAMMNDKEDSYMNECDSYLQDMDLYASSDFMDIVDRKWTILRKSSLYEEDDNGN